MTRINQYLAYHNESARIGDIDPSYHMLRYVCDRFELSIEQRYWLAFIYALTYNGASTFYVYNEFPDYENVNIGRMNRWWDGGGRAKTACQTDRRWVRSNNLFVPAVESYQKWLGGRSQQEHFAKFRRLIDVTTHRDTTTNYIESTTPEMRYDAIYKEASMLVSFGQFALFLYLEALHTITPLNLMPTRLDLNKAWSCRDGLYYAYGRDEWIMDEDRPIPADRRAATQAYWDDLQSMLEWSGKVEVMPTIWQTETILCAFRKFHRGKRYVGYYLDRQALEIAKMEAAVQEGVAWDVLWDYRRENLPAADLVEGRHPVSRLAKGLPTSWVEGRRIDTNIILHEADPSCNYHTAGL